MVDAEYLRWALSGVRKDIRHAKRGQFMVLVGALLALGGIVGLRALVPDDVVVRKLLVLCASLIALLGSYHIVHLQSSIATHRRAMLALLPELPEEIRAAVCPSPKCAGSFWYKLGERVVPYLAIMLSAYYMVTIAL